MLNTWNLVRDNFTHVSSINIGYSIIITSHLIIQLMIDKKIILFKLFILCGIVNIGL